jgi:osomolarity two-component system response regulator SKN7
MRLVQSLDQLQSGNKSMPFQYASPSNALLPTTFSTFSTANPAPTLTTNVSPPTDNGSRSSGDSPAGFRSAGKPTPASRLSGQSSIEQEDVIELPLQGYGDVTVTSGFNETTWFDHASTFYMDHRKSSDGATIRRMVEALAQHNRHNDDTQDPLDTSPRPNTASNNYNPAANSVDQTVMQQSPFGTLLIPPSAEGPGTGFRLRRSTTIKPSWTHAPKILVVEDDVVYRQLSTKFLEKFGCQIETVENAQVAIERMNTTRYDLVLMDIFFGPHMDG